jgi:DNA-directed RNA polymerase specialized sigma24 family protein
VTGAAPAGLPLPELLTRSHTHTARYHRGEPSDDRYSREVFRRAVLGHDERCWEALYHLYHDQVLSWCRQTGSLLDCDAEELVTLTWEKFWANFTADKFAATTRLSALLSYLKLCAHSVVVDLLRARHRRERLQAAAPREDHVPAPDDTVAERDGLDALWREVHARLRDERERELVRLAYGLGLRPAQVQARRPDLFPAAADVYRATRNLLDRLRRDATLRDRLR